MIFMAGARILSGGLAVEQTTATEVVTAWQTAGSAGGSLNVIDLVSP
ncbi:MAG TPA: hypothetical protein VHT91_29515 [Kofleriaceae bacterium]|jgi:hypothetical protein|nr:hypothetical protein [Kofleriaceae bacterium]